MQEQASSSPKDLNDVAVSVGNTRGSVGCVSETCPDSSWTVQQQRAFLKGVGGLLKGKKADLLERAIFL